MSKILQRIGILAYWAGWPAWLVYFKLSPSRGRVLVIHDEKILLVKAWLSDGSWGLPGGGFKRGEAPESGIVRELAEETGIKADPKELEKLDNYKHTAHGFRFTAYFYALRLSEKPLLSLQAHEIAEAGWFGRAALGGMKLSADTRYGLEKHASTLLLK